MLFTALTNRLFGSRHSRNDYKHMASTFSTKTFFERYPAVRTVLLGSLREKVRALDSNDVYAALHISRKTRADHEGNRQ